MRFPTTSQCPPPLLEPAPPRAATAQADFSPPPTEAAAILIDFNNSTLSLHEIAARHRVSIESLTLWLNRPDIRDQLLAIESVHILRARMCALAHVPAALDALASILKSREADEAAISRHSNAERSLSLRQRHRDNLRRAAAQIIRVTRLQPLARATARSASDRVQEANRVGDRVEQTNEAGGSPRSSLESPRSAADVRVEPSVTAHSADSSALIAHSRTPMSAPIYPSPFGPANTLMTAAGSDLTRNAKRVAQFHPP